MFYPLDYYYQDVLGRREDVAYHLVFGIVGHETRFERLATTLVEQLERGCPLYVSSLGFPERNVLNYAYRRLDDASELADIRSLSTRSLVDTFPTYGFDPVSVDAANGVEIYRIVRR